MRANVLIDRPGMLGPVVGAGTVKYVVTLMI